MTDKERIEKLEAENAELRRRLDRLELMNMPLGPGPGQACHEEDMERMRDVITKNINKALGIKEDGDVS